MLALTFFSFQWLPHGQLFAWSLASMFHERRTTMTQTAALEIVWRNPKPPQRQQRWEQVNLLAGTACYLLEELVSNSIGSFWTTISSLEITSGGRAPGAVHELALRKPEFNGDNRAFQGFCW